MPYYHIIPLIKLPLKKSPFFTYFSEKELPWGSLVEIDFAHRRIKGLCLLATKKPFFKTKKIGQLIAEKLLDKKQLELAEKISEYYFTPLGVVLKFFLPPIVKKIPLPKQLGHASLAKAPLLTAAQKKAAGQIAAGLKEKSFLLFGPASAGKTEVIMAAIKKFLAKKQQTLVLIPEIFLSYQEIDRYCQRFGKENVCLLHSGLKASEFFSAYQAIRQGKTKVIITTRIGIFLPFKNLGLLVVDEEQDLSHKQWDQSPRYHLRQATQFLAHIHQAKLIYASATPSLETYQRSLEESKGSSSLQLLGLPMLKTKMIEIKKPLVQIIDLKKYFFRNRNLPVILSDEFKYALDQNLKNKKLALILVSRRGKSKAIICQDCKKILRCQNCDSQLVSVGDDYRCIHCNFKVSGFSHCPNCGSYHLKNIGFGTEKIASVLGTIFPSARIEIADQTVFQKESQRQKLYEKLKKNDIDILIGSPMIIKGFDLPRTSLVSILNAEDWSGKNDFRFDERYLSNLFQLAGRINRPGSDQQGQFIVQTFRPEEPIFSMLKDWQWSSFLQRELTIRKALSYPPFTILIKLIYKNSDQKKVDRIAKTVYNKLLAIKTPEILDITAPYYGFLKKIRNRYEINILLKLKNFPETQLKSLLQNLANDWIIDVEPETIF